MAATAPFEIVVAPFQVYTAPINEVRPDLADAPAGNWLLLGTNGSQNYSEDGVSLTHEQETERIYTLGNTGPVKAVRTREGLMVALTLLDLDTDHFAKILNDITVTTIAAASGTAGIKRFSNLLGTMVNEVALLIRGDVSPHGANFKTQWWIPKAYQESNPNPVFHKGDPVGLAVNYIALEDATNGFGFHEAQNAAALA